MRCLAILFPATMWDVGEPETGMMHEKGIETETIIIDKSSLVRFLFLRLALAAADNLRIG